MVTGLNKFRDAFASFTDCYVVIGGTACVAALTGTSMRPRETSDIDIILIVENMTPEFGRAFWQFIKDGDYRPEVKKHSDSGSHYELYRFVEPTPGYPGQIELLSRRSDVFDVPDEVKIEPLPIGDDISSLSAIVMDDDYYNLTVANSYIEDGIRYANPAALICLKIKAYLNLLAEREAGRQVNTKDIKKHRNDVIKLAATASFPELIEVPASIQSSIIEYVDKLRGALPDQSLEAAIQRNSEEIAVFLDVITETFIP